ncbi:MAG: 30S ribosomal protein S9 [Omnitrophica bacterium RIFCSPLOWO2_01_FULL_45_10]|nr:MAG: 30S ribosomal protein S9 [Omnitrophica bacterium RIFCSPLOWO2_01_FULL_45_10]
MAEIIQYFATGRRKNSIARVRLLSGTGKIVVNSRTFENYFSRETYRLIIMQPLEHVKLQSNLDIYANVEGGGNGGQAGAVQLGIARAIVKMDEGLRQTLKKAGFLTRDPRMRERKKYGRKRARRKFQYSKR